MNRSALILASLFGAAALLAPAPTRAEELPTDPRLVRETLNNGFTWMFHPSQNPLGRVAMMLHIRTGSLNETEAQLGLTHFVETLAFEGSENMTAEELAAYFEEIGMPYGADVSGRVGLDQTQYDLFLPTSDAAALDRALRVLSDVAYRLEFPEPAVEETRTELLAQLEAGLDVQQRMRDALFSRLFKDTRAGERLPIGTAEVLRKVARADVVDYYKTWYRPEFMTLIIVGDTQAETVRPLVEKWFGSYFPTGAARRPHKPAFKAFDEKRAFVLTDPEYAAGEVLMIDMQAARPPATTVARYREKMVEKLGAAMLIDRLAGLVRREAATFGSANIDITDFYQDGVLVSASCTGDPAQWQTLLSELVAEIRRVREHGFRPYEFQEARDNLNNVAAREAQRQNMRSNRAILQQIATQLSEGEPYMGPAQEHEVIRRLLPTIALEEINQALSDRFAPGSFTYVLQQSQKADDAAPDDAQLLERATQAWAQTVEPWPESPPLPKLLPEEPQAGTVTEQSLDEDLGITSAWLSNNVRVHHRRMTTQNDQIMVSISLIGGKIQETAENAGITETALLAWNRPATSRMASQQFADVLGQVASTFGGRAADDAAVFFFTAGADNLDKAFAAAHALLTDPRIEQAGLTGYRRLVEQGLSMYENAPGFKAYREFLRVSSGNDPRRALPDADLLARQSVPAAQAWLDRLLKRPMEVAIVGPISAEEALRLAAKYLGSLPERPRAATDLEPLRQLDRPQGPVEKWIIVEDVSPQSPLKAMVYFALTSCDAREVDKVRKLNLAAAILKNRFLDDLIKNPQAARSFTVEHGPGMAYRDSGVLMARLPCQPEELERALSELRNAFETLAEEGPTQQELDRARRNVLDQWDQSIHSAQYWWWEVLRELTLRGIGLEPIKNAEEAYKSYTPADVRAAFASIYKPENEMLVVATGDREPGPTTQPAAPVPPPPGE